MTVELNPEDVRATTARLKRARGQLDGVIRMLEEGRDCEAVVTQVAAVSKAVDRAGLAIIAAGLRACYAAEPSGEGMDVKRLERMFLSLS
ncbi:metal-sensitive transcriptional regulator [Actinomyces sp. W5033]|uniref:metal-sensitive transcriptional regulator n=1 Tax=Actinomyces sp. W5033 TaxID=3446479 RepID=UPI003EE399A2